MGIAQRTVVSITRVQCSVKAMCSGNMVDKFHGKSEGKLMSSTDVLLMRMKRKKRPPFIDEETRVERSQVICPESWS